MDRMREELLVAIAKLINDGYLEVNNNLFLSFTDLGRAKVNELVSYELLPPKERIDEKIKCASLLERKLYKRLRAFRAFTSKQECISAWRIFTNSVLEKIISVKPKTIRGIIDCGLHRDCVYLYGEDILRIIKETVGEEEVKKGFSREMYNKI